MLHMFVSIIRSLFGLIDGIVVWAIESLYVLLVKIAYTNVFGDFIYAMLGRIYIFLGIFMVFKLSLSMITYIISPDAMTDKNKGFGKLIQNVCIALILIVTVPSIFREAFKLQGIILNTNAIYQIVTGKKVASTDNKIDLTDEDSDTSFIRYARQTAGQIAWGVYQPFIYANINEDELRKLNQNLRDSGNETDHVDWVLPSTSWKSPTNSIACTGDELGQTVVYVDDSTKAIVRLTAEDASGKEQLIGYCIKNDRVCTTAECLVNGGTVTAEIVTEENFLWFDDAVFKNEYKMILSTIVGGFVAYCFLVFCFDASIRAIKLGILQIIAPVPILSMIDPKGGVEKLKKWATTCGKEYAGLFLRLAAVFFAVSVIELVLNPSDFRAMRYYDATGAIGNTPVDGWVKLFIILGCLMFAKQLPKFIEEILGVKLSGDGFNLKKRFNDMAGIGIARRAGAGALGFAGGMAANAWAAGRQNFGIDKNKGFWGNVGKNLWGGVRGIGSMAAGGMSGGVRGAASKEKNMFKAGAAGAKGAVDKRNLRDKRQKLGEGGLKGMYHRTGDAINRAAGTKTRADILDDELKALQYGPNGLEGYQDELFAAQQRAASFSDFQYLKDANGMAIDSKWMDRQTQFMQKYAAETGETVDYDKELTRMIEIATGVDSETAASYKQDLAGKADADSQVRAAQAKVQEQQVKIREQQVRIDNQKKIDAVNKKQ